MGKVSGADQQRIRQDSFRSVPAPLSRTGRLGKKDNFQLSVFLAYVTGKGHAPMDRRLYLPEKAIGPTGTQFRFTTGGGDQVPLPGGRIDGAVDFGQYMRMVRMKSPFGAGSQFACLPSPGDSCWK